MKPIEMFAALVTRAGYHSLNDAMWLNSAGVGSIEDQWDEFQYEFEKLFGISWKEAEQVAERFFAKD